MRKFFLLLPLVLVAAILAQNPPTRGVLSFSLVFTQMPFSPGLHRGKHDLFLLNRAAEKGSRIVIMDPNRSCTVLTAEFSAASDPCISFDGGRILFSGKKKPQDAWNVWEMDVDGKNKRQITRDLGNCREPEYLAKSAITPPDFADKVRWITFTSTPETFAGGVSAPAPGPPGRRPGPQTSWMNEDGPASSLYVTNLEQVGGRGFVTWRTTFNLCSDFSPTVLRDGRVLFASAQTCDAPNGISRTFPLLATNWDGSGLNLFCGAEQGAAFKTMACETPDRHLVFVEAGRPAGIGGRLARVSFRRPLHSYEVLSRGAGEYLNPRSFPNGGLLVSYTSGKESYGLYLFDFEKGAPGEKLFSDPGLEALDAQPVVGRPEPQGLISSVIDSLRWGELFCLNVYESDIPAASRIKKGDVKQVRFLEGIPQWAPAGNSAGTGPDSDPEPGRKPGLQQVRMLGEAPVEPDGSFFVRIPADTPMSMQLLDEKGTVLQTMHRWIWVRRGTSRGCIGCHENKELAPENRVPAAIMRGEPHDLTAAVPGRIEK